MSPWTGFDFSLKRCLQRAASVISLAAVFICALWIGPLLAGDPSWEPLKERLVADGLDRARVEALFAGDDLTFSSEIMARKMSALLETRLAGRKPGPAPKPQVMERYLNPILLAGAYAFHREQDELYRTIEARYGVPGEVLTALMLVETRLGTQVGKYKAMTILANMALARDLALIRSHIGRDDLSPENEAWLAGRTEQKGNWAYVELKSLITYADRNGLDPLTMPSSMYGAIGLCQFIPSSAVAYGRDGNGDGRVDLFDMTDALHSMAYFIQRHGWREGLDREAELKVIYRYNHSESYALTIMAVADKLRKTAEFFGN
ncbi:lytic murein transglycosylase [Pseudodesulfovibrio pelocollis]|uniref:lytic murein transglycosylase n=1 Tax=Pseudodesulfovibrio pelocollis TaxID=3051432 RepID=UPI00255AB63A|nr:lytic murein transglycosylase [Pseudodesulfovibrio sp. SB368]